MQMGYHNRHESGELIGRVSHDTGTLQSFLVDGLPWMLVNAVSLITIAIILLSLQPYLALFVFLPVPVLIIGGKFFHKKLLILGHRIGNRQAKMHSQLGESIRGVKAVKASSQENRRAAEFNQTNDEVVDSLFIPNAPRWALAKALP